MHHIQIFTRAFGGAIIWSQRDALGTLMDRGLWKNDTRLINWLHSVCNYANNILEFRFFQTLLRETLVKKNRYFFNVLSNMKMSKLLRIWIKCTYN